MDQGVTVERFDFLAVSPLMAVLRHWIYDLERPFLFFALPFGIDDNTGHSFVSMIVFLCGEVIALVSHS